ncbi:MAG: hypothetical protein LBC18_03830 [Opitutaceae bacterium]|nr:hypothetical protein [Opitutaceae bacterium]
MASPHQAFFLTIIILSLTPGLTPGAIPPPAPGASPVPGAAARAAANTFTNPLALGADPFITRHDGAYYWCQSVDDSLTLKVSSSTISSEAGGRDGGSGGDWVGRFSW